MTKIHCEICKKDIEVPNFFKIDEAIEFHLYCHLKQWINDAVEFINKQDTEESKCLIKEIESIRRKSVKILL